MAAVDKRMIAKWWNTRLPLGRVKHQAIMARSETSMMAKTAQRKSEPEGPRACDGWLWSVDADEDGERRVLTTSALEGFTFTALLGIVECGVSS